TPPAPGASSPARTFARPPRFGVEEFPLDFPGARAPVMMGVTDVPVHLDNDDNHQIATAQKIPWPCEVSGRLAAGDERDWYLLRADRGDGVWLDLFCARDGSPVDLDLSVLDARGERELLHLTDHPEDPR